MIQRRQTLYLLCAVVVLVLAAVFPLGKFLVDDKEVIMTALTVKETGVGETMGAWPLVILAVVATLIPFVTIFLYKRRLLQIRLCFTEFVFLVGLQGFIVWCLWITKSTLSSLGEVSVAYGVSAILPLVAMVFVWLALRGIMKDEALIRSMNRIR